MIEYIISYYVVSVNKYELFLMLEGFINCDVCVVGGGYIGFLFVLYLVEMGYDVVVLEGVCIGFGVSGCNGGQLVNFYSCDIDVIEKNYGLDVVKMFGSMMFEGGDIICECIQWYQIQCDYCLGGLFVVMNYKQLEILEEQKVNWECYGNIQLELLDREVICCEVDSDCYVGVLFDYSGGYIYLLNFVIGEVDVICLNGGWVYEQLLVICIQYISLVVVSIVCGQVIVCYVIVVGNVYFGDKLELELVKCSMLCGIQVVIIVLLLEEVVCLLILKNYCVEDCNYLLDYYCLIGDNCLLYGGGVVYGVCDLDDVEWLIMLKLLKIFLQLQGVKIDYCWMGNFLLILLWMLQFGCFDNNIYYMQGYSGYGVICIYFVGCLILELLCGDVECFDVFVKLLYYLFLGGCSLCIFFIVMGVVYYSLCDCFGV